jgi:hypothetical protein
LDRDYKQHELHLWIYYMSKFLNTSEFIIMIFKIFKKIVFKNVLKEFKQKMFKKLDFQKSLKS